jgi:hypothetical protein
MGENVLYGENVIFFVFLGVCVVSEDQITEFSAVVIHWVVRYRLRLSILDQVHPSSNLPFIFQELYSCERMSGISGYILSLLRGVGMKL